MATFGQINFFMKKLLVFALIISVVACSTKPENGFVLNGTLTGNVADSTKVFLRTTDSLRQMVEVDTTMVIAGAFEFTGETELPKLHYLFFGGIRGNSPIILEKGEVRFKAQKDSLAFAELRGTLQNELFMEFLTEKRIISQMGQSMTKDLREAQATNNQAVIESLREEYFELQEKSKAFDIDFVKNNPNSLVSVLVLEQVAAQKGLPLEEVEELSKTFTPELQKTEPAKRLKKIIEASKGTEIGSKAPEFSGPTPSGEQLALNDVKGKVTLVDFWAAWCKPCRMENPNVVAVYNKYKDKGLSVVGVSLDRKKEDWLKAIEDDKLDWNHVSHVQYFQDPIAQLYNVNAIPAAFLLDENGVIIAKNLRGSALEQKVAELLN